MSQQTAASTASLRALIYRITSTPTKQLPKIASQIASAIWTCRDLLSAPADSKKSSDAQTTVHRFKTQLSTLLQDRTVEGRWAAVVFVKAAIEAGGAEVLSKSNPWVRSLLGILKKPDPPTTRILAVLALTRIFTLTWDNSTLIREITTPALTAFIPTCLANLGSKRCSSNERQTYLDAFATLVPRHPTIFRTNESKLRAILGSIISSTSAEAVGEVHYNEAQRLIAAKLWVLLNSCAPKSGGSEKWDETLTAAIKASHSTADRVFRAVEEEWQSTAGIESAVPRHTLSSGDVEMLEDDAAGLNPWKGIYAGGERLISLIGMIQSHISTATPGQVSVRVGLIADLLTRLFGVSSPIPGKADFVKFNNQISRDEREAMFAMLPTIHTAALELATIIIKRLELIAIPFVHGFMDQAAWVFRAEVSHLNVRRASYDLFSAILELSGPSLSKGDVAELEQVFKSCCQELLRSDASTSVAAKSLDMSKQPRSVRFETGLQSSAQKLLRVALAKLDSSVVAPKVRALIDRTAVLTKDKDILLSSILNAPKKQNGQRTQASLLPILASEFPERPETEALLRPRMPPIAIKPTKSDTEQDEDMEDDESVQDAAVDDEERENETTDGVDDAVINQFTTEELAPLDGTDAGQTVGKRRADDEDDIALSAKRLRASPVAESLLPERMSTLSGPEPSLRASNVPETVVIETSQSTATIPIPGTHQSTVPAASNVGIGAEASQDPASDDSDFEMPPLTMEPDTDPEDED